MNGDRSVVLDTIFKYSQKPALFEPGEPRFWDDPHISKSMLEAHLDPTHDAASRRPEKIDKEVQNLVSSGILKTGDKILDLGCGPGLYASRLAEKGMKVTGVDISRRSLDYALSQAKSKGLDIEYRCMNFFDIDYSGNYDAVMQTEGELGTFSDEKRDALFLKIHRALKPGGVLVFDVTAPKSGNQETPHNHWYVADAGFWRPSRHLVFEQVFEYPEDNVRVDQYIVVDERKVSVYRIWIHDYTPESLEPVLKKAGFQVAQVWNDLAGTPYSKGGDWLAVVAKKGSQS